MIFVKIFSCIKLTYFICNKLFSYILGVIVVMIVW